MSKRVGIPKALFYYYYFPLWKTFFEELGAEVVVSGNTTKRTMDEGSKTCVDEACLPIKIFFGHVIELKDKVDYLLIPRFTSVSRGEYICPKFGGLPDMIKNTVDNLPEIIDVDVDLWKKGSNPLVSAFEAGSYFTGERKKIMKAYSKALESFREFRTEVKKGVLPEDILSKKLRLIKKVKVQGLTLLLSVMATMYTIAMRIWIW